MVSRLACGGVAKAAVFERWVRPWHCICHMGTSGVQLWCGFCGLYATVNSCHLLLTLGTSFWAFVDFETADRSRNNWFLSLITLGEGWHNNHHYYAGSTRQGFYWWQLDITYYILKLMSYLGLVWGIKPIPAKVYQASKIAQARRLKQAQKSTEETQ